MKKLGKANVESLRRIDGIEVMTNLEEFDSFNIIQVEAGTTGFKGGDSGHGCRTYFKIEDKASTDMRCRVISNGKDYDFSEVFGASQIEIMFGGDTELESFIGALEFAANTLRKQAECGDTRADIMTQLQKASKTVLELSSKNKELIKDVDAMKEEVKASKAKTEEYYRLMHKMENVAVEAQNLAKRSLEDIKALQKELNDDVAKMDRLRAKEMAWRIAFFLFAGISAVELLYMYCNRLF